MTFLVFFIIIWANKDDCIKVNKNGAQPILADGKYLISLGPDHLVHLKQKGHYNLW